MYAKKYIIYTLVLLLILIVIIELYINYTQITYYLSNTKSKSDVPTIPYIIKKVSKIINRITKNNKQQFLFIDIGCGDGNLIKQICRYNIFHKCIGLEYDLKSFVKAKENCKDNKNIKINYIDALNYNFNHKPTIFYLYEPFFDIEYNKAMKMYNKLLYNINKLSKSTYDIYIIYVSGIIPYRRRDITKSLLNKYNFTVINKYNIGSLFIRRNIYLAKFKNI